ncbi:hypothetical protein V1514DRAFT_324519 [Lipomyces japonicus]|uniref:uncharacterized protein n=1 Tax=Lipomyces japonicus TaxID=56871 RepID=UPI0034CE3B1F
MNADNRRNLATPDSISSRDDEDISEEIAELETDTHSSIYSTPPSEPELLPGSSSPTLGADEFFSPDIERLRRDHTRQGYLDGITRGKPESVQKAFDDGYPLGAALGIQVGKIIGTLQGLKGLPLKSDKLKSKINEIERVIRSELLDVQLIFGDKYWAVDSESGDVVPLWLSRNISSSVDPGSLEIDASNHPLLRKWLSSVDLLTTEAKEQQK